MKNKIGSFLKVAIPLGLGFFLVYWMFRDISEEDKTELTNSFKTADYWWIILSTVAGLLSHASRAYRWKYALRPLGYEPKFINAFFTVMIGYLANMLIPRMGEVSRCAYLAKHEDMEFNKVFGTVIAERVVDFVILMVFILAVFFIQFETMGSYLMETPMFQKLANPTSLIILGLVALGLVYFGYKILSSSTNVVILKIKTFVDGLLDGISSIMKMKDKWAFIFHTTFIWAMYLVMFYVAFFSMDALKNIPIGAVISAFVAGSIAIAATNGGLGAYPLAIMAVLSMYGIEDNIGKAFGWIIWTAQAIMLISVGLLSLGLIPLVNKNYKRVVPE
jgi:uncharacterized protein (TIRG00374 family)